MKWIDYRERLGIGFSDSKKARMFQNNILRLITEVSVACHLNRVDIYSIVEEYLYEIGENSKFTDDKALRESIEKETTVAGVLSRFVIILNLVTPKLLSRGEKIEAERLNRLLFEALDKYNIQYELFKDKDGIFIFPKGAPELDEALVSAPLEWLNDYPESRKAWIKALNDYADQTDENASDIADKFRKALERFMQEFFGSEKSLENLLPEYGEYLKGHGVPAEISNDFKKLLNGYTDYINNYAKHHDRTSRKVLEYIMYETGNVMRLLITLKQEETSDAD